MKDTFKLGKVDARPLRPAEIGNLEARRLFSSECVCTNHRGGFWRTQSGSEVCVCGEVYFENVNV